MIRQAGHVIERCASKEIGAIAKTKASLLSVGGHVVVAAFRSAAPKVISATRGGWQAAIKVSKPSPFSFSQ